MSVAIRYHKLRAPSEAGVVVVTDAQKVAEQLASLKRRGFVVDKVSDEVFTEAARQLSA